MARTKIRVTDPINQLRITEEDGKALARALLEQNISTYEAVARAELASIGRKGEPFRLQNPQIRKALERDARESAAQIRRTFNRELRQAARDIRDNNPKITQGEFVDRLQNWFRDRQAWKGPQIGITEAYKTQQRAVLDFYERSNLDARFWFGGSLECPICQNIAARNPYTRDAARGIASPVHVNCGDAWTAETSKQAARNAQVWNGE